MLGIDMDWKKGLKRCVSGTTNVALRRDERVRQFGPKCSSNGGIVTASSSKFELIDKININCRQLGSAGYCNPSVKFHTTDRKFGADVRTFSKTGAMVMALGSPANRNTCLFNFWKGCHQEYVEEGVTANHKQNGNPMSIFVDEPAGCLNDFRSGGFGFRTTTTDGTTPEGENH
ncbi:hypothetical protein M422DRAFT_258742 [Sphaerobolus stellatus SS14]|uniref:Unplaced genomic scaffold SPHSTscaffold_84, whole genome shotgun sequence n=1 Tax=Sphaerobolus stellatus (strain SS14) TaxID=990650 RepID=A0A0C9U6H9_SPHS4|nr:hypothetical protein M422DRAFT_258742 [Sphaerobolus stellatus SS14]